MGTVTTVVSTTISTSKLAPFKFFTNTASVDFNTDLLQSFGNDFTKITGKHEQTPFCYSSEFRSLDEQGMDYVCTRNVFEDEKIAELKANIAKDNHHLATIRTKVLKKKQA